MVSRSGRSATEGAPNAPAYCGIASVILPIPDLTTWLPYRKDISAVGFTHTLNRACAASSSSAVMRSWNRFVLVNLPTHTPSETRSSRPNEVAAFISFSDT